MTDNPMVSLNRAVAAAMVDGPGAGLALLEALQEPLAGHHRLHAVRAHLMEMAGEVAAATPTTGRRRAGRRASPSSTTC
jgi:predicted RNA polymerase sigma factor